MLFRELTVGHNRIFLYKKKCVIQTLYFATFRRLNYNISTHRKLGYTYTVAVHNVFHITEKFYF